MCTVVFFFFFFFNDTATTEIYTLSLHDALPICPKARSGTYAKGASTPMARKAAVAAAPMPNNVAAMRSEEHTSELQSQSNLVCRLLLEKKKNTIQLVLPDLRQAPLRARWSAFCS